jgi:nitric oxide reductase NorD protein
MLSPVRALPAPRHPALRERLGSRFPEVDAVFDDGVDRARLLLSEQGLNDWLDLAGSLGRLGRGPEPLLVCLEAWPEVAQAVGEGAIVPVRQALMALQKSPNGRAIAPLLQTLPAVARRLGSVDSLERYLQLVLALMTRTSVSIHGHHATEPSPGLPAFLAMAPQLVASVPLEGLARWMDAGIRLHGHHPERQVAFFKLRSPDSRALLQRERHGTLLMDAERRLALSLRGLWRQEAALVPYPVDDEHARVLPHMDKEGEHWGFRLPEVLDAVPGASGMARYRAMLAHLAAHREFSQPRVADNLSPLQRLAVECFEDARVDHLTLRRFPGLAPVLRALHPRPKAGAVDLARRNGLRHRLALLSCALLQADQPTADPLREAYRQRFLAEFEGGADSNTARMAALALEWVAQTRVASDQFADVAFEDTHVDWRDDNRHLWTFIEAGDEESAFDETRRTPERADDAGLPPRLYPEWDAAASQLRPDWASVYDSLQAPGNPGDIAALMAQHEGTARHLKRLLDALKPQDRTRLRQQEEGSELDLDAAVRAICDLRAGLTPDFRVQMSTRSNGRNMAVLLLLDLSASVNDPVPGGSGETVLSLSRAAVALLAWAIDQLGDQLAIAGFHSNTRHEVRYWHIKGFGEAWNDAAPQARLAGVQGAWSTRMGAALRHAGHLLSGRTADKRLLLVLTDGQPADVDVADPQHLIADAAHAVRLLDAQGLHTHCVSLDPKADDYVTRIFGRRYSVIDRVAQLPRRLPEIFMSLTR